jgi:hypothetical protein
MPASARAEIIEHSDFRIGLIQQQVDQMRSDKAGAAGNKIFLFQGYTSNRFPIIGKYLPDFSKDWKILQRFFQCLEKIMIGRSRRKESYR